MKKFVLPFIFIVLIVLGVGGYFGYQKYFSPKAKHVHYHAGFVVFNNDKQVDFSKDRYMHEKPCMLTPDPNEDEQIEKAHLHERVGNVVHVHRDNATWRDLFTNLNYVLDGQVTAYSNGREVDNLLTQKIQPYESVVFFVGTNTDIENKLKKAVTVDQIKKVESTSEQCGS